MPFVFIAFILISFVSFLMGYASIFYAGLIALFLSIVAAVLSPKKIRKNAMYLVGVVFSIYWISSAFISAAFENGGMFYVKDPSEYYLLYKSIHSFNIHEYLDNLTNLYLTFKDNNALYNSLMAWLAYKGNVSLGGANMMYYTAFHLLFGVLSALAIYRILCTIENDSKAMRHAILFCIISLFHIYSCVCVRDIWVAAVYLWAISIVIQPTSFKGLIGLLLLLLFAAGVRIYSGMFFMVFIVYYLYRMAQNSKFKGVYYAFMFFGGIMAISSFIGSLLLEQTIGDMDTLYEETGADLTGLSAYLVHLPHGVKEPMMVFYSQIMQFPSWTYFKDAYTFSHYYTSVLVFIFPLFSFFVFYGLLYMLFVKKKRKLLKFDDWALIIIAVLLIFANSTQMDIRRVMPSFFVFYFTYIKIINKSPQLNLRRMNTMLGVSYCGLLFVYSLIKFF